MNAIKGLITKDLLQLKSYKKSLLVFIIVFIATAFTEENEQEINVMLGIMLTFGFGMFSIATFSYDEMAKADRFILTLPLTRKEIVLAKYIFVITSTVLGGILGILASFVIGYAMERQVPNIGELMSIVLGGIFGIGLIEAVQIPCIYKWGAEKGRIQMFIAVVLIGFVIGGIFFLGEKLNFKFSIGDVLNNFTPIILLLATVILYFVSYKIALNIYAKKEI